MIRYFRAALRDHVRRSRTLYLLTVAGVALGVASVLCIQILSRSALAAFRGGVDAVSGESDLTVVGFGPSLPESLLAVVLRTQGVAEAWPLDRVHVALPEDAGAPPTYLEIVGVDLFALGEQGPSARAARDRELTGDPVRTAGWVALSPSFARERGVAVGDRFEVESGSRRIRLQVGALIDFQQHAPTASRKTALMDIAQTQALLGTRGEIDQIDVQADEGTAVHDLASRLAGRLGPTVRVLTPEQRLAQAEGLLSAFRLNLTALSLVSLIVGLFLVHSSVYTALSRRRRELGLLRALGASRAQVVALVLAESATLGLLGSGLGLPLGLLAAQWNVDTVSGTLSNIYLLSEIERLEVPRGLFLLAGAVGIGGALLGALFPALEHGRREIRALLVAYTIRERTGTLAPRLALAGGLSLAAALALYRLFGSSWRPSGFAFGLVLVAALALVTPWVVDTVSRRVAARGFGFRYSVRSLRARLPTTSFAVAALAIAVTMLVGVTILIGSFRETVSSWVAVTLQADVYLTSTSWSRAESAATLDPELVRACEAFPGVSAVDALRQTQCETLGGRTIRVNGIRLGIPGGERRFPLQSGDASTLASRIARGGAVVVTEPLARKEGLAVGDTLRLRGARGPLSLPIAAVSYDYSSEAGAATMDMGWFARRFGPGAVQSLALYLAPGEDPERTVDALRARFARVPLEIRSNRGIRAEVLAIFDQTFAVTRILQGTSLVVAATGITLTLLVLARSRTSELALYRALGATRPQLFRSFVGEGLGIGLLGLALGALGGLGLAALLIYGVNLAYFGWTIHPAAPWPALARQAITILAVALAASLVPSLRASATPASELSREDL